MNRLNQNYKLGVLIGEKNVVNLEFINFMNKFYKHITN